MYAPSPLSNRDRLANWLGAAGILRLAELLPQSECLIVMNHHRIGDPRKTPFDPGVFSGTADDLEEQVRFLKRRFRCLTLEEAVAFVEGRKRLRRTGVLLTFDDGYLDNYQLAFPILRSHGVPGLFFLPTSFIGTCRITWWDRIAYWVKHANHRRFTVSYPAPSTFDLDAEGLDLVLLRLFRIYKLPEMADEARFMDELRALTGASEPPDGRLFLDWDEAREMLRGGMHFGSHTHNHALLAKLPREEQIEEIVFSRELIRQNLGIQCESLAYPYGLASAFTGETMDLARAAGYRIGFSFCGGLNRRFITEAFNVRRQAAFGRSRFQMRMLLGAVAGITDY
jgi:peptidoglycan/xylan/chitin deacetylase (PgdA/CDA1 family)